MVELFCKPAAMSRRRESPGLPRHAVTNAVDAGRFDGLAVKSGRRVFEKKTHPLAPGGRGQGEGCFFAAPAPFRGNSSCHQHGLDAARPHRPAYCKVVLPNPDDPPAIFPQRPIHPFVPRLIPGEFPFPEGPVAGRDVGMFWAGVPEAAIHEQGHPRLPKNKIRLAEDLLIPPPARDAVLPQQQSQRQFRLLIPAPANPRQFSVLY